MVWALTAWSPREGRLGAIECTRATPAVGPARQRPPLHVTPNSTDWPITSLEVAALGCRLNTTLPFPRSGKYVCWRAGYYATPDAAPAALLAHVIVRVRVRICKFCVGSCLLTHSSLSTPPQRPSTRVAAVAAAAAGAPAPPRCPHCPTPPRSPHCPTPLRSRCRCCRRSNRAAPPSPTHCTTPSRPCAPMRARPASVGGGARPGSNWHSRLGPGPAARKAREIRPGRLPGLASLSSCQAPPPRLPACCFVFLPYKHR